MTNLQKLILKTKRFIWKIKLNHYFEVSIINLNTIRDNRKLNYYYSVFKFLDNIVSNDSIEEFSSKIEILKGVLNRAYKHKFSNQ